MCYLPHLTIWWLLNNILVSYGPKDMPRDPLMKRGLVTDHLTGRSPLNMYIMQLMQPMSEKTCYKKKVVEKCGQYTPNFLMKTHILPHWWVVGPGLERGWIHRLDNLAPPFLGFVCLFTYLFT